MLIGVIADTHGWLDPAVLTQFAGVDAVLVAGDIGSLDVVRQLAAIAPVHAVRGNNDEGRACGALPGYLRLEFEGFRVGLSHFEVQATEEAEIGVFGHSHRVVWDTSGPVARLNPGAAGRRGLHRDRTIALLELCLGRKPAARHIVLGGRSAHRAAG